MNKTKSMLTVLAAAVLMMISAFMAQGQTNRSFVSGTGNDGANLATFCQQTAPCRTFQAAIGVTNAGGQVVALDSTGYSGFSISKSITIEGAPGVTAFIFAGAGTTAVVVTGTSNNDLVIIRNIFVDGLGGGSTTGLNFTGPAKLVVDNCTFRSLTTGISLAGTNSTTSPARMDLIESHLYGNTTAIVSTGEGLNSLGNPQHSSTTSIRIRGGNITDNGTGLNSVNQGTGFCNIAVFTTGGSPLVNLIGNATNQACSGAGCNSNPCPYQGGASNPFGP